MIDLKKITGTNIYEFTVKCNINKEEVEEFYQLLDLKSQQNQKIKLLGIVEEYPGFEDLKAFGSTMQMKAKAIANIGKYAVLTDKDWIMSLMPAANFITPGFPIKNFELNQRDKAIEWLKEDEENTVEKDDYLSQMNIERIAGTKIYILCLNGKIDEAGMTALYNAIKKDYSEGKKKILLIYKEFDGFDSFKAFTSGIKLDFSILGNVDKVALITNKKWARYVSEVESKLIPSLEIKGFEENEKERAIKWLER